MKLQIGRGAIIIGAVGLAVVANAGLLLFGTFQTSGRIIGWGINDFGQLGNGSTAFTKRDLRPADKGMPPVRQLSAGLNHTLALTESGEVWGWGSNAYGQLAQPSDIRQKPVPVKVAGLPQISQVAAGQDHSVALAKDGSVWTWGLNISGQLGTGDNTNTNQPRQVQGIPAMSSVNAGYRLTFALSPEGDVWAWGGKCRADKPSDPGFAEQVKNLAVTGAYSNAMEKRDHTALRPEEDCINEAVIGTNSLTPVKLAGLPPLKTLSAGFGHVLAIDRQGDLWAWGCNTHGQLGKGVVGGDGTFKPPAKVPGFGQATAVSAGFRHSLALKPDGTVWTWGHNYSGELGNGQAGESVSTPQRVADLAGVSEVAAGYNTSFAVRRDGSVLGWGDGNLLQIGEKKHDYLKASPVWSLNNLTGLTAGGGHVIALKKDTK